jgi:hypothetical protein
VSHVWVLFFHLAGMVGFLLAHGTSAGLAFALRRERDPERMRRLLQLSEASFAVLYPSLLVLVVAGVVGGFRLHAWSQGWIWAAIVVLVVVVVVMATLGGGRYSGLRKALGIKYREGFKILPATAPGTQAEIDAAAARLQPLLIAAVGIVALAAFLYLMIVRSF